MQWAGKKSVLIYLFFSFFFINFVGFWSYASAAEGALEISETIGPHMRFVFLTRLTDSHTSGLVQAQGMIGSCRGGRVGLSRMNEGARSPDFAAG